MEHGPVVKPFAPDPWLSETLERPVFKWTGAGDGETIAAALSGIGSGFVFAKVPPAEVSTCSMLTDAGFRIVDTSVTFAWGGRGEFAPSKVTVTPARPEQFEAVQDIAGSCFRWSRFHLDPLMPKELADRVKRRWIENYCLGVRGAALYAAELDGVTAGFLAVLTTPTAAVIDLVGVANDAQGKGVGTALTRHFVDEWKDRIPELRVGTQVANIRSMRLYERAGFSIVESAYVLHAHVRDGWPQ